MNEVAKLQRIYRKEKLGNQLKGTQPIKIGVKKPHHRNRKNETAMKEN